MKINKKPTTRFKDIPTGAVFRDTKGTIYMKLDCCYKHASIILYNTVNLENGSLTYIDDQEEDVEVLDDAVLTY
jgi:hypothetical protein